MRKKNISILIILLAIGFAAVATTLTINGTVNLGFKSSDYIVVFTKALLDGTDVSKDAILEEGKRLDFETNELVVEGTSSKLEFTVTNSSTQYDAEIALKCSSDNTTHEYYSIDKYLPSIVKANKTAKGYINVTLLKASANQIIDDITCEIEATAITKTLNDYLEENRKVAIEIIDEDGSLDTIGTEIAIGTEHFFVIPSNDDETLTLLSKFNLHRNASIQLGKEAELGDYRINFSANTYWSCPNTSCFLEDGTYFNLNDISSLKENNLEELENNAVYKAELYGVSLGGVGRLLTYEEIRVLAPGATYTSQSITGKHVDMISGTYTDEGYLNYWLGSAYRNGQAWGVKGNDNSLTITDIKNVLINGIRPVVEIPLTKIQIIETEKSEENEEDEETEKIEG